MRPFKFFTILFFAFMIGAGSLMYAAIWVNQWADTGAPGLLSNQLSASALLTFLLGMLMVIAMIAVPPAFEIKGVN